MPSIRKAAENEYAVAQGNLGLMYAKGEGVPQDNTKAVMWFRKAAERDLPIAQFYLGLMYAEGRARSARSIFLKQCRARHGTGATGMALGRR